MNTEKGFLSKQNVNGLIRNQSDNSNHEHLDVELLSQILTSVISSGRSLQRLPRILTLLEHLEEIPGEKKGNISPAKSNANGELHEIKNEDEEIVYISNILTARNLQDCIIQFKTPNLFNVNALLKVFEEKKLDFSAIIKPVYLPLPSTSLIIPISLILIYIQLIKSPPKKMLNIQTILAKLPLKGYNNDFFKSKTNSFSKIVQAIIRRKLRFNISEEKRSKLSIKLNEYFEIGFVNYLKLQHLSENLLEGEVSKEHFKTRSELSREYEQQLKSIQSIKEYYNVSEKIIYTHLNFLLTNYQHINKKIFNEENLDLIMSLIRQYIERKIKDTKIPECCFFILIRWCFMEKYVTPPEFQRRKILEFLEDVKKLMLISEPGNILFSLSIFYLGSAIQHLEQEEKEIIIELLIYYMKEKPNLFFSSNNLTQILNGIGLSMIYAKENTLINICYSLVGLWNNGDTNIPALSHSMQIFDMFFRLFNSQYDELKTTKPKKRSHSDEPIQWIFEVVPILQEAFYLSNSQATRMIALYAAGGLFKGLIERDIQNRELREVFSRIITSAIVTNVYNENLLIIESIALLVVNLDYSLPSIPNEELLQMITFIFTESIFNLSPHLIKLTHQFTNKEKLLIQNQEKNQKNNNTDIYKIGLDSINLHYQKEVYLKVSLFSETMSSLWGSVSTIHQTCVLYSLNQLSQNLHHSYSDYLKTVPHSPQNDVFDKTIIIGCNTLYLSLLVFFSFISSNITEMHALQIINILSDLEFCSVKIEGRELELKTTLVDSLLLCLSSKKDDFIELIVNHYDELRDENNLSEETLIKTTDILMISRFSFLLHIFDLILEKMPSKCSENILETKVVPICFIFLDHSNKVLNSLSHSVFQKLFIVPIALRETILPYYLKKSLDNYPLITQPKSISSSMSILVSQLDPSSPFIPLCIESFIEKIKSTSEPKMPYLTIILFELVNHVHRYLLPYLLSKIEDFILTCPLPLQNLYARLLFQIISKNFDYTRKEFCIKWYLELCKQIRKNRPKL